MAGPANPIHLHPAAYYLAVGVSTIPLTLSADIDFTVTTGPTSGNCPRNLLIGGTAGNVVYYDLAGDGPYTVAVPANQYLDQGVSYLVDIGTTATPISAVL